MPTSFHEPHDDDDHPPSAPPFTEKATTATCNISRQSNYMYVQNEPWTRTKSRRRFSRTLLVLSSTNILASRENRVICIPKPPHLIYSSRSKHDLSKCVSWCEGELPACCYVITDQPVRTFARKSWCLYSGIDVKHNWE